VDVSPGILSLILSLDARVFSLTRQFYTQEKLLALSGVYWRLLPSLREMDRLFSVFPPKAQLRKLSLGLSPLSFGFFPTR